MIAISNNWISKQTLGGFAALVLFIAHAHAQYDPDWTKNFRVGALTGLGVKGQIKLRGQTTLNNGNSTPGVYDDGYVRTDETGNAGGYTSFWGYENASQYDASSQTLSLHRSSSLTAEGSHNLDQEFTVGFELAYGQNLKQWGRTRLGWEFGFGLLPISLKDSSSSPISGQATRSTFTFDTGGIVMPTAPYHGGSSGIGPTIRDAITGTQTNLANGTITDLGDLEATLFTFRLGPTLFYDLNEHIGLMASAGPAMGFATQTCRFNSLIEFEDGTTARDRGSFSATDLVYGGYVSFVATYHADVNGDVYIGVQYMPMSGTSFSEGSRTASLDLMGQVYFSLGVNWIF